MEIISDKNELLPEILKLPRMYSEDVTMHAVTDLTHTLLDKYTGGATTTRNFMLIS